LKITCGGHLFSFEHFKEKVKFVYNKICIKSMKMDDLFAAKLAMEISKQINQFNIKSMAEYGLVGDAWIVLMIIYSEEDLVANDICEILGQNKSTVSRIIESLKEKEFISENRNKDDRRKNNLSVTESGLLFIKEKMIKHNQFYENAFKGVNSELIVIELQKVLENINKNNEDKIE